jgi:hypothetical protein
MDVRAANNLVIEYDFDRDGWSIGQPDDEGEVHEVAFAEAWAVE